MYEAFKLIHVSAAIIWLGAGVAFAVMNARVSRSGNEIAAAILGEQGEALGKTLFMPASIVTLLAGIGMVVVADSIGFGDLWITLGFAGIIVSAVLGAGPITKATEALRAAAERGDRDTVAALQKRVGLLGTADLTLLFAVVWAMVYKPGA